MNAGRGWIVVAIALSCCSPGSKTVPASTSSQLSSQRVSATPRRETRSLVHVTTPHGEIVTTPEHPFAKVGAGWVEARTLAAGDWVRSASGEALAITAIRLESLAAPALVFNLSVDRTHAFFVGLDAALVHNTRCGRQENIERQEAELEALKREMEELENTQPTSPDHAAEIQRRKAEVKKQIRSLNDRASKRRSFAKAFAKKKGLDKPGEEIAQEQAPKPAEQPHKLEADLAAKRAELDQVRRELKELEHHQPTSPGGVVETDRRRADLERRIRELTRDVGFLTRDAESAREVAQAEARLKELLKQRPRSAAQDAEIRELRERIKKLKKRTWWREYERSGRKPPDSEAVSKKKRLSEGRRTRPPAYEKDTERPRDELELAEAELALARTRGGAGDAQRVHELEQRIVDLKRLVEVRRELKRLNTNLRDTRNRRADMADGSPQALKLDQKLAELERRREQARGELRALKARQLLRGRYGDTQNPTDETIDPAWLEEITRDLFLDDDETVDPAALAQREREFLAEVENQRQHMNEELQREQAEVDAAAQALRESLARPPSPERHSAVEASIHRLQQELAEERREFERNDFALANEYAYLDNTLRRSAGSSRAPEALVQIQEKRANLRLDWQQRIEARLNEARGQLRGIRRNPAFHDEELEAELTHHIALLEHELARGP